MPNTRIGSEQARFKSSLTGEHSLDTYLEDCELGGRQLSALLGDIFDTGGEFKASIFEFRVDPLAPTQLQARVGVFESPAEDEVGWVTVGTLPPGSPGAGTGDMLAANNLSDVSNVSASRTNLGLDALAVLATVGTSEIDDNSVTLAKIAHGSNNVLIGTDGSGAPSEITAGGNVTISGGTISSVPDIQEIILNDGVDYTAGVATPVVASLPVYPGALKNVTVTFDGLTQHDGYSISAAPDITFTSGIPDLVQEVRVRITK